MVLFVEVHNLNAHKLNTILLFNIDVINFQCDVHDSPLQASFILRLSFFFKVSQSTTLGYLLEFTLFPSGTTDFIKLPF